MGNNNYNAAAMGITITANTANTANTAAAAVCDAVQNLAEFSETRESID